MNKRQSGFTLVEIAIVLVIIGLLLGGILKGQELINSARVRNLADTNAGVQAAYYGFIDRYRQVPGDMVATLAAQMIGDSGITWGGDGNGQLAGSGVAATDWQEANAAWIHMTRAGFLQGTYSGPVTDSTSYIAQAPKNSFNGTMLLARTRDYSVSNPLGPPSGSSAYRLGFVLGNNIPVDIAQELDTKIDDQSPLTGTLRFTGLTSTIQDFTGVSDASTSCMTSTSTNQYDIAGDNQNCNLIYLY
jgi:prepilin-type N-terminal cleavage/methylation domain-containing protein